MQARTMHVNVLPATEGFQTMVPIISRASSGEYSIVMHTTRTIPVPISTNEVVVQV